MNHSEKTKDGIAKARAAGKQWGAHGSILGINNKIEAQKFAESLRPVIFDLMLEAKGVKQRGPKALAEKLNKLGVPTARSGKWHSTTVRRVMNRLEPSLTKSFMNIDQKNQEKFMNRSI